ncbi:ABC transporter ATP-binding protein [Brucella sp. BE17]|uniref:ABC transporter ATP-binding protein n=1 Tax=Brucella sp. BE17 TaxID=3142977 RepID=UPI0031BB7E7B
MNASIQTTAPIIEITNGQKSFGAVKALSDINLSIKDGEILTLLGPSGCGKTTLMRMIAGFDNLTEGGLKIDGRDAVRTAPEHRPVNMVFQRYALFPHLDVFDNVAFGLRVKGVEKAEIKERVTRMLHIVQLDNFANRYIHELSGGQCQRVALARALVNRPRVLLLDEPLAALDLKIRQHMLIEMKRIHMETGATFIYVTHDQDEALILSDRVALMDRGRIVQVDRPEVMYSGPKSLFAAKFLGETNIFECVVADALANRVKVRSGFGSVFESPETVECQPGQKMFVSIRPELLSFEPSPAGSSQSADVKIEDVTFIGSRSFYTVGLPDNTRARLQVQRNGRSKLPAVGESAQMFWEPESLVFLPAT